MSLSRRDFARVSGLTAAGLLLPAGVAAASSSALGFGKDPWREVPAGTFLTGAIRILSNVELHVSEGATIKFSTDPDDYLPLVLTRWEGSRNITVRRIENTDGLVFRNTTINGVVAA